MQGKLNILNFEKYFFFGLVNKEEVIKWIIINVAKIRSNTNKEIDQEQEKTGYEKDKEKILDLIVQLERFTSLHDDTENRQYFYDSVNRDSETVQKMFNKILCEIEKKGAIIVAKEPQLPMPGIFFNARPYSKTVQEKYDVYSGEQYINYLRSSPNTSWGEELFDILCYLQELEHENRFEYYSLFLDSKYARAIDRNKNNAQVADDREIHEIRNVYRKFLKR
ncbi:MAG: hypothetical protein HFJ27_05525 [Clostridia bacterium]|nr:hypothetical protein [Clostridia bacterium]